MFFIKINLLLILYICYAYCDFTYPSYTHLCSDSDNTFLDPCTFTSDDCYLHYGRYFYDGSGRYIMSEDVIKSIYYNVSTYDIAHPGIPPNLLLNQTNTIPLCYNQNTGKSCRDYAQAGGHVMCGDLLFEILNHPQTNVGTYECSEGSWCFCEAYFFEEKINIIWDGLLTGLYGSFPITYCIKDTYFPEDDKKRSVTFPITIDQNNSENITCWTQDIGESTFLVIHRNFIPLATSTVLVDFGYNAVETYNFVTLDLPIEIPNLIKNRGGFITATDIEGGLAVASCLIELEGDKCYGHDDSITDLECASTTTKMLAYLIYIIIFVIIILGLMLIIMLLYKLLKKCFNARYSRIPLVRKTGAAASAVLTFVTPTSQSTGISEESTSIILITLTSFIALVAFLSMLINVINYFSYRRKCKSKSIMKNDYYELPTSSENYNMNPSTPQKIKIRPVGKSISPAAYSMFLLLLVAVAFGQNCQEQFFLSQNNLNCENNSGLVTCSIHTDLTTGIDNPSKSICFTSTNPLIPLEVSITYMSSVKKLNLEPMYYTDAFNVISERACICDISNQGAQECLSCDGSYDVDLCDLDETEFVQYRTTRNYCTYSTSSQSCDLSYTKIYTSNHYALVNTTPSYLAYEVLTYDFYPSIQVKVKSNNTETVCNGFLDNQFQSICGISFRMKDEVTKPLTKSIAIIRNIHQNTYFYADHYNKKGSTDQCALGILQMPSYNSVEEDDGNLWGNICTKGLIDEVDLGFSCGSSQLFDCCVPSIGGVLPQDTIYGTIEHQIYNNLDLVFISSMSNLPINFDVSFNDSLTFQTTTTPVCPKVTFTSSTSGCFSCDSLASFTIGALSTCSLPDTTGSALLTCPGINIMNPVVLLTNTYQEFIINFKADQADIDIKCTLEATSSAKFNVEGELSYPIISIQDQTNGTTTTEFFNQAKELQKLHKDSSFIKKLEIAIGVVLFSVVLIVVLILIALCIGFSVTTFLKKMV